MVGTVEKYREKVFKHRQKRLMKISVPTYLNIYESAVPSTLTSTNFDKK